MTLALFRVLEASSGGITLGDVPIESFGLHQLRARLTILPQESLLFRGSVRFNLDPTVASRRRQNGCWPLRLILEAGQLIDPDTEARMRLALQTVGLASGGHEGSQLELDSQVEENGANLSAGQRQLLCLARALLRRE